MLNWLHCGLLRLLDIFDLDRDGQPEVYATLTWRGKPCSQIYATVLATWRDNWSVMRRFTYLAGCPWFESGTAGDLNIETLAVVDIDGDGVAEVILSEQTGENWRYILCQFRDGKLVELIHIGDYGL